MKYILALLLSISVLTFSSDPSSNERRIVVPLNPWNYSVTVTINNKTTYPELLKSVQDRARHEHEVLGISDLKAIANGFKSEPTILSKVKQHQLQQILHTIDKIFVTYSKE